MSSNKYVINLPLDDAQKTMLDGLADYYRATGQSMTRVAILRFALTQLNDKVCFEVANRKEI